MFSRKLLAASARQATCCRRRPQHAVSSTLSFHSSPPLHQQTTKDKDDDKIEVLFQKILWLDMFEVHILTELLNEKMGFGGLNALMGSAAPAAASGKEEEAEEAVEEKTLFDLKLTGFDAKAKIKVIKEVRSIAELGLKEAKELVEGAPKVVKKDMKKEEAEELQKKLEAVGATIEIV